MNRNPDNRQNRTNNLSIDLNNYSENLLLKNSFCKGYTPLSKNEKLNMIEDMDVSSKNRINRYSFIIDQLKSQIFNINDLLVVNKNDKVQENDSFKENEKIKKNDNNIEIKDVDNKDYNNNIKMNTITNNELNIISN